MIDRFGAFRYEVEGVLTTEEIQSKIPNELNN